MKKEFKIHKLEKKISFANQLFVMPVSYLVPTQLHSTYT